MANGPGTQAIFIRSREIRKITDLAADDRLLIGPLGCALHL
jgi:hypothetical protein